MRKFLSDLAWETEVWIADSPDHLIHFNGDKFLGPREFFMIKVIFYHFQFLFS